MNIIIREKVLSFTVSLCADSKAADTLSNMRIPNVPISFLSAELSLSKAHCKQPIEFRYFEFFPFRDNKEFVLVV